MTARANLWAVGYDDMKRAEQARDEITQLGWGEGMGGKYLFLLDIAVVVRHPDGSYTLDRKPVTGIANIFAGAALGLVGGLTAVARFAGAMIGALMGVARRLCSAIAPRLDDNFVREAEALMKPGSSALFVLDDDGDMGVILKRLQGLGGTILKTNVDPERANVIQRALATCSVAQP